MTPSEIDFSREVVYAQDCLPCLECGEPVCPVCLEHYADCPCPGPHSEREEDDEWELAPCLACGVETFPRDSGPHFGKWTAVGEGLPEPMTEVLLSVRSSGGTGPVEVGHFSKKWGFMSGGFPLHGITHWMPLPEPPR